MLAISIPAMAADLIVPSVAYPTIQSAINAAVAGDRVLVASGTYNERINFLGTAVEVRHDPQDGFEAVIDGLGVTGAPMVTFENGEGRSSILTGFVIKNGRSTDGGGIKIDDAEPTIINCKLDNNTATGSGGGVHILDGLNDIAGLLTHAPRFMQPSAHGSAGKRRVGLAPWSVSIAAPVKALHTL